MEMTTVYVLTHAFDMKSVIDEELEERAKLIGVYTSEGEARRAVERLTVKPGFCDYPNGFIIDRYHLNQDGWQDGFFTIMHGDHEHTS
jgi:homoserine kinase type II